MTLNSIGIFEVVNMLAFLVGVFANIATIRYFRLLKSDPSLVKSDVPKTATLIIGQSFFSFDLIFLMTFGNREMIDLTTLEVVAFMMFCVAGAYGLVRCIVKEYQEGKKLHSGIVAAGLTLAAAIVLLLFAYPVSYLQFNPALFFGGAAIASVIAMVFLPKLRKSRNRTEFIVSISAMTIAATFVQAAIFSGVTATTLVSSMPSAGGLDSLRLQCLLVMDVVVVASLSVLLGRNPRLHWRRYAVSVGLVAVLSVIIFVSTDRSSSDASRYLELSRLVEKLKTERLELQDLASARTEKSSEEFARQTLPPDFFNKLNRYNETVRGMDRLITNSHTATEIKSYYFGMTPSDGEISLREEIIGFSGDVKKVFGLAFGLPSSERSDDKHFDGRISHFSSMLMTSAKEATSLQILVKDMSLVGGFFIVAFMISGVLIPAHTSTVRALDELEAEKARVYKLAICAEHTNKGVVLTDMDGKVNWCNDAFTQMSGYTLEEIQGRSLIRILRHPNADMAILAGHIDDLSKGLTSEIEILARRKNLSDMWLRGVVTPVEKDGNELQFVHVYEDETEALAIRERLETARKQSERLALIAKHASDGMAILDDQYRLIWMNPAMEKLTGFAQHELVDKNISKMFIGSLTDKSEINRIVERVMAHQPSTSEVLLYPKFGSPHWVEASHTPIFETDGRFTGYIIVHRDVTERKNLELQLISHRDELAARVEERTQTIRNQSLELEKALDRERELNRMQTEFVSMASHEFRTPLTIIDGTARRIEKRADRMEPEDIREKTSNIRSAVKRMTMLVERTLDASRLSSGRIKLTPEWFNLPNLMKEVVDRQREVATSHTIEVDIEQLPTDLFGDARLLDNVVTNVVSNAVKYSGENKQVKITGFEENGYAVICVRDSGIGIPKEEMPKLFQRFFRASTSTGIPGTGIGLNLVKSLVEMHYGSIEIDSEVGEWTEVTIKLPLESPLEVQSPETNEDETSTFKVA